MYNSAFSVPARRATTSLWRFCAPSLSAVALLGVAFSRPAAAAETRYFSHADQRYLEADQRKGGAAFIPSKVPRQRPVPLVVFLHGTNSRGRLHPWLGGSGDDLRLVAEALVQKGEVAPFVLAGPSQTRDAKAPAALWQDFDLKRFVRDVQSALRGRAEIDERWVALFGHSGAGCNPDGGLASRFGELKPRILVAIDPCLDPEMGAAISTQAPEIPFWVLWQTASWRRDFDGWFAAAAERSPPPRATALDARGGDPHDKIVPRAFATALRELFSRRRGAPATAKSEGSPAPARSARTATNVPDKS